MKKDLIFRTKSGGEIKVKAGTARAVGHILDPRWRLVAVVDYSKLNDVKM